MFLDGVKAAWNSLRYPNVSFRSIILGNVDLDTSASIEPNCFLKAEPGSHIYVGKNVKIERGCQLFALNNSRIIINDGVTIKKETTIMPREEGHGGTVEIGKDSVIHYRNSLDLTGNIEIGPDVRTGENTYFHTHTHVREGAENVWQNKPETDTIVVGEGCWIGTMCQLMPGSVLPAHNVLAAGGIATRKYENKGVFAGVPAERIKE